MENLQGKLRFEPPFRLGPWLRSISVGFGLNI